MLDSMGIFLVFFFCQRLWTARVGSAVKKEMPISNANASPMTADPDGSLAQHRKLELSVIMSKPMNTRPAPAQRPRPRRHRRQKA